MPAAGRGRRMPSQSESRPRERTIRYVPSLELSSTVLAEARRVRRPTSVGRSRPYVDATYVPWRLRDDVGGALVRAAVQAQTDRGRRRTAPRWSSPASGSAPERREPSVRWPPLRRRRDPRRARGVRLGAEVGEDVPRDGLRRRSSIGATPVAVDDHDLGERACRRRGRLASLRSGRDPGCEDERAEHERADERDRRRRRVVAAIRRRRSECASRAAPTSSTSPLVAQTSASDARIATLRRELGRLRRDQERREEPDARPRTRAVPWRSRASSSGR